MTGSKLLIERLFDNSIAGMTKAMDLTWRRNEAISSNIANAETPGYRAVDVNFASELEQAFSKESRELKKTDSKHLDLETNESAHLVADLSGATRADGNNVDIDLQMGRLTYNAGRFNVGAALVRRKMQQLREAIRFAAG